MLDHAREAPTDHRLTVGRGLSGRLDGHAIDALVAATSVSCAIVIFLLGRGIGFGADDFEYIAGPPVSLDLLLTPHNGHLSLLPMALYRALFVLVGLDHVWVFRLVLVGLHALSMILLYIVLRPVTGERTAAVVVAPVTLCGGGWNEVLAPFQISFLLSITGGLGALWLLRSGRPAGRWAATLALTASVASSGVGLAWLAAAWMAVAASGRRRWPRSAPVVIVPSLLYALWYARYGTGSGPPQGVLAATRFTVNAGGATAATYTGLNFAQARFLVVPLAAFVVQRLIVLKRPPALFLSGATGAVAFWFLAGYFRPASTYAESRYLYPGVIFLCLAVGGLLPRRRLSASQLAWGGLAAVTAIALGSGTFLSGRDAMLTVGSQYRARLAAVESARDVVPRAFVIDPTGFIGVQAGSYLDAVARRSSSPALTLGQILAGDTATRSAFDETAVAAARTRLDPSALAGGGLKCSSLSTGVPVTLELPASGLTFEGRGATVSAALAWAADAPSAATTVRARATGAALRLVPPPRPVPRRPWRASVSASEPGRVCVER